MKYCIYITELHYGCVHVEADNDKEAIEKAHVLYAQGQVLWHDGEISDAAPTEDCV